MYATALDLELAAGGLVFLTSLTDWDRDGTADASVLAKFIADAQGEVDSVLKKNFEVPLAFPTAEIIAITARIAVYRIRLARAMVTEEDRKSYDRDVKILEEYRDGTRTLGVNPTPLKSSMVIDGQTLRPETKSISRAKLRGFS